MNKTKVVIIGQADFAGSGYQAANAVNSLGGEFFVRHISMQKHPFGFPHDIIIPCHQPSHPGTFAKDCDNFGLVKQLIKDADIIHVWNNIPDDPRHREFEESGIDIPLNKPIIITMTGSLYRMDHIRLNVLMKSRKWPLTVQDPMLKFPNEIDSTFIPHAVNTKYLNYSFSIDSKLIGTYEYPLTKGTRGLDVQRFTALVEKKLPEWSVFLVGKTGKMKWKERMKALSKCSLFFQDIDPDGYWGRSALESCSMGISTFGCYADKTVNMSEGKLGDIPIINVTWDNLEKELFHLVENDELRKTMSEKTREWIEKYFSYEIIGKMYTKMYEEALNGIG